MKPVIVVCGHGPGISDAVARRFGQQGYAVAIVARQGARLAEAAQAMGQHGVQAQAFPADLGSVQAVRHVLTRVRAELGRIDILHWNAYSAYEGTLLQTPPEELSYALTLRVVNFLAAVQECLPDLEARRGAILATSGVMARSTPEIDRFSAEYAAIAIAAAAQRKACGILEHTLQSRGIFVGQVIVNGFVEGTQGADGKALPLKSSDIAEAFWQLHSTRSHSNVVVGHSLSS